MKRFQIPYMGLIFVIALAMHFSSIAQQPKASFVNLPDSIVRDPVFIAELGDKYLFFETGFLGRVNICSINKTLQIVKKKSLPNSFIRNKYELIRTDSTVSFLSHYRQGDSLHIHLLKMNNMLEVVEQRHNSFQLPDKKRSFYELLGNDQQQYFFLYHIWTFNEDSAFIYGQVVNRSLELKKEVAFTFSFRNDLDTLGNLVLDNNGNIHVLVYDKPYNYKLSSSLNIYTIPFQQDEIISETFTFQKKKLRGLYAMEDSAKEIIHLQGLFLEGHSKNIEGVIHIGMPVTRGLGINFKTVPFQNMNMQSPEKQGKKNPFRMLNNLKTAFYIDEYNKTRLIAELPAQDFSYIDTFGTYQQSQARLKLGEYSTPRIDETRRMYEIITTTSVSTYNPTRTNRTSQPRTNPVPSYNNSSAFNNGLNFNAVRPQGNVKYKSSSTRAPRIYSFNLNDSDEWLGFQHKTVDDFFNETYNMHLPIQLGGHFYVLAYAPDKQDEPLPVLIDFENEKPVTIKITNEQALERIKFLQIQKVNAKKYLGIYRN